MGTETVVRILRVLAAVLLVLSTVMVFGQDRVFDPDDFASTVSSTLSEPAVNRYLSDAIADELIEIEPNLAVGGSLLEEVIGGVLESSAAAAIVEGAASEAHVAVFAGGENGLVLELSDLVVSIDLALSGLDPDLASAIPEDIETLAIEMSSGNAFTETTQLAQQARNLTIVLVVLTVASLLAIVWIEPNRWRSLGTIGLDLGLAGLFLIVSLGVGESIVRSFGRTDLEADALAGAWNVVLGDLRTWAWVIAGVGAFAAGLAWSLLNVGRASSATRDLLDRVTSEPATMVGQTTRLAGGGFVAVWAIASPLTLAAAVIRVAGFVLAVIVARRLVGLAGLDRRLAGSAPTQKDTQTLRGFAGRAALPIALIFGVGALAVGLLAADEPAAGRAPATGCNGHVQLCERRLDQVTFAASHNSMSSTENSFLLPNHLSTIVEQLDAGIRGLMLDTHYGRSDGNGNVISRAQLASNTVDAASVAAAEAVRERANEGLGEELVYLCHSFCEIGALDAVDELDQIEEWLRRNPREVLIVIVQDATEPQDTAAAFDDAGLDDLVWTQRRADPMPTLGEMIDADRRLFVMVEENGDGVDWLHPAFSFSQETPFSFGSEAEFSCDANRGDSDSPLFVINHFITLALPANQTVNDRSVLLPRAETCERTRGLHPNLLAVDYATRGDVVAVAAELNGLAGGG
ncbi:MAG: hypothetical protein ACR2P0_14230 [Acidimicrobiales bacterium]